MNVVYLNNVNTVKKLIFNFVNSVLTLCLFSFGIAVLNKQFIPDICSPKLHFLFKLN
jgi:hypothetical protein